MCAVCGVSQVHREEAGQGGGKKGSDHRGKRSKAGASAADAGRGLPGAADGAEEGEVAEGQGDGGHAAKRRK